MMLAKVFMKKTESKFQTSRVLSIAAGHAVHDTYTAFIAPLLPVFINNLLLTRAEAGLLTVFVRAPSVIQPLIGHLADRYHLHHLFIFAPAIGAVLLSITGVINSYPLLILILLIAGFNSAALHAVGPVLAGRLSGESLGRGMSFWMVGGEFGRTIGPIVVVTVLARFTIKGVPWLMFAGLAASVILYIKLRDVHIDHYTPHMPLPWKDAVRKMKPILLPLAMITIGRSFVMASLTTYLPTFLTEEGFSLWTAGVLLTGLQGAGVIGALVSGSLSDRFGRRLVLLVSIISAPLFLFVFLSTGGWLKYPLLLILGFTTISSTPVFMAMVQENYPENRALANGIYMFLNFILSSGVIVAVGLLGDMLGLRKAYIIGGIIMLACSPFVLFLPSNKN